MEDAVNIHMSLSCLDSVIGASDPEICWLFMPKTLDMNANGSCEELIPCLAKIEVED